MQMSSASARCQPGSPRHGVLAAEAVKGLGPPRVAIGLRSRTCRCEGAALTVWDGAANDPWMAFHHVRWEREWTPAVWWTDAAGHRNRRGRAFGDPPDARRTLHHGLEARCQR